MTKAEELYKEYCNEYPLIMGYREVSYECWLQKQVLELRENVVNKNCNIPIDVKFVCKHLIGAIIIKNKIVYAECQNCGELF